MNPFDYTVAPSVDAAVAALGAAGRPPKVLAGGTTLVDLMRLNVEQPAAIVDINRIPGLDQIDTRPPDELVFGALARMSDVADDPVVRRDYPVLSEALWRAASQQLRNMASLGGNLLQRTRCAYFRDRQYPCNKRELGTGCSALGGLNRGHAVLGVSDQCIAVYPGDLAIALVALDASIDVRSVSGARTLKVGDLHREPGQTPNRETALAPDELILRIRVPKNRLGKASTYLKIRDRESYAFAIASAAVALDMDGDVVRDVRIAVGGLATRPWRVQLAEQSLVGKPFTNAAAAQAGRLTLQGAVTRPQNAFRVELGANTVASPENRAREGLTMTKTKVGANAERVDGRDKVMGKAIYGADRLPPHMVHALPITATIGKGNITTIDLWAAEAVKGVLVVLDYRTLVRLKPVVFSFAGGHAIQSLQPLQSAEVAYRGQAVALVVAETVEAAYEAAARVKITYACEPFDVEMGSAGREEVKQAVAAPYFPDFVHGDPEAGVASAPVILDEIYKTSPQHQNPMELLSVVAEWDGDHLTIHEGSQASQAMQGGLALQLDMPADNIRVIAPYVGGGFGQRGSLSPHTIVLAAIAARKVGRPVKLTVPRSQVFHATSFRGANEHHIQIGATRDGRLTGGLHLVRAQTSRFDLMPYTGEETTSRMYAWPAFRGATTLVKLDTQTPGFMRAPMEMGSFFALESAMDELANKLDMDPVALRLKNDAVANPITGKPFSSRRLKECLERGAARFGWDRRSATPGSMRDPDGTLIGWGVAAGAYPGYIGPALAKVRLTRGGKVVLSVGGHEMGQGFRTAIAVVAASELGVDPETIEVRIGDTAYPPQHTTAGAWGAATATMPVRDASRSIRRQLAALAIKQKCGPLHGQDPASLTLQDGWLVGAHGRQRVDDILRIARAPGLDGEGRGDASGLKPDALKQAAIGKISTAGPEFPDHVSFSFVAHFAEVRIDPRLPRPRVTRFVTVVDCGRVISRRTAESQAYGGIVWGIGSALCEGSEVDPRFGGFLNNNIAEYQIAVNADVRRCEVEFIDQEDPNFNGLGAKGLGEVVCVGAAAAVANAVHHASGRRVRSLPIRMEALLA